MSRELVGREDKKAFWGVVNNSTTTFTRMKGFTTLSESKNAIEYSRRYIDEKFEQSDVRGYSPSWAFTFDEYTDDAVLTDIVGIIDDEKTGADAVREVVFVDFSKPTTVESATVYPAVKRSFTVVGDSTGDSTDASTYSGTLKVKTSAVKGTATIATPVGGDKETVETVTFTAS